MSLRIEDGIGSAWRALAAELLTELRQQDPTARVQATLDASGLLRLAPAAALPRPELRRLRDAYEARAAAACEACGAPADVTAGAVVGVSCASCRPAPAGVRRTRALV